MKVLSMVLLVCVCFAPVYGRSKKAASMTTADELRQMERNWTAAMEAADATKLSQILADDWSGLSTDGGTLTKQEFLNELKSGEMKLQSFDFGPMDVKVIGEVAVVQGSDTEKSMLKGKDTSGKWVWMDVFEKHNGKWQAVRSQVAKVQ